MKNLFLLAFLWFLSASAAAQIKNGQMEGTVTFKSKNNVYVKFYSTEDILVGDTLHVKNENNLIPALVVKHKSSTSCVSENISSLDFTIGQSIIFNKKIEKLDAELVVALPPDIRNTQVANSVETPDSLSEEKATTLVRKQKMNGRISFSTNGSISDGNDKNFQRIRMALSMNVQNISASAFSLQSYVTYRHRYGIDQSQVVFYDDFKIYALNLQYAPSDKYSIWIGRKINNVIANMGAIDGIQGEVNIKKFSVGAFAGTRPDINDYSFNQNLMQFGAYLSRHDKGKNGLAQTSLAFAEQQNNAKTDRRFMYFQHNNSLVKNLNIFLSAEMDMYKKIGDVTSNELSLTSVFFSLRYRIRKNLSFSSSYDNRRNVIFYESYQTYIEQLLAQETRQGVRFQVNYSPFKLINLNVSTFLRFQGSNPQPTKNYVGSLGFNNVPGLNVSATLTANILESYYFKGNIYGGRVSKNFMKGKLQAEVNYRNINYTFFNSETSLVQNVGGLNLSMNVMKLTSLMLSYEGTFEPTKKYHRYFITAVQRFKH
jgi:hypothetical protein